jgi:hypothetical protein
VACRNGEQGIGHHPSDVVTDDIDGLQFESRRELMDVLRHIGRVITVVDQKEVAGQKLHEVLFIFDGGAWARCVEEIRESLAQFALEESFARSNLVR